jgi:hypothetical protein
MGRILKLIKKNIIFLIASMVIWFLFSCCINWAHIVEHTPLGGGIQELSIKKNEKSKFIGDAWCQIQHHHPHEEILKEIE